MGKKVPVLGFPPCDMCKEMGKDVVQEARYDAPTMMGPWAYMCNDDFDLYSSVPRESQLVNELVLPDKTDG